jgi:hypothetical protein
MMELINSRIIESLRPNLLVPFYLINSYLYYQLDTNVIHDKGLDVFVQKPRATKKTRVRN